MNYYMYIFLFFNEAKLHFFIFICFCKAKRVVLRRTMVLIWYGSSEHVAHIWRKIGLFRNKNRTWRLYRCNQMPSTNLNICFNPFVRTVILATIWYTYHGTLRGSVPIEIEIQIRIQQFSTAWSESDEL